MNVLGISALYHDSAAVLCNNGEIIAAAQEERFTRKKADSSIPINAINYCLSLINGPLDAIVYYDNPFLTLDRWLSNCIDISPDNDKIIDKSFEEMFANKLWIHKMIKSKMDAVYQDIPFYVCEHHISHAASAFYPSPFSEAAIITVDGVGEWATSTIGIGKNNSINLIEELEYPDSVGLLYSAFTYFCGFKVNFGEYKMMGLAPYGKPIYYQKIMNEIVDVKEDGSIKLNMKYFSFYKDAVMTGEEFEELFGVKRRKPEERITQIFIDIAASIQAVTEEIFIRMAKHAKKVTGCENLVLAGGSALNCVANGKLAKEGIFKEIWVQPAASDAGGALGAALFYTYNIGKNNRVINLPDSQKGSYLGPTFSNQEIKKYLDTNKYKYEYYDNNKIFEIIAKLLAENKVIGLLNGRMEFGPRALGGRSIIANPMSEKMQSKLNLKIKFRESFRPFAPAVLLEDANMYFDMDFKSPYMLMVAPVKEKIRIKNEKQNCDDLIKIVNEKRSLIPAVTHVDYSARIQTVSGEENPFFYNIIKEFKKLTKCSVIVNTSFNVRGEPIVCTPEDAYLCFMRTDMDALVLENYILYKEMQLKLENDDDWRNLYELD